MTPRGAPALARFRGPDREHLPGRRVGKHDVAAGIEHDLGHDVLLEQRFDGAAAVIPGGAAGPHRGRLRHGQDISTVAFLAQDVLAQIDDLEHLGPGHQGF